MALLPRMGCDTPWVAVAAAATVQGLPQRESPLFPLPLVLLPLLVLPLLLVLLPRVLFPLLLVLLPRLLFLLRTNAPTVLAMPLQRKDEIPALEPTTGWA